MAKSDWDIPTNLRPEPDDYRFDLARALRSVVGVRASVPQDAFTAGVFVGPLLVLGVLIVAGPTQVSAGATEVAVGGDVEEGLKLAHRLLR